MASTARVAWIDAWEGASTPSPYTYRSSAQRVREDRYARERTWTPETGASVVRMSAVRQARRVGDEPRRDRTGISDLPAIDNYDWDAAARRRPARNESERVILHTDRSVEARMSTTQYYAREATARRPDPWPEAERRRTAPKLRVVKRRASSWRLGLLAGVFAALFIGLMVIAPIMTSSKVAGLESAVGQAESQQQQLSAATAALSAQISSQSSPQRVAEEAAQLGLVPANQVSYLPSGDQMLASDGDATVAGR